MKCNICKAPIHPKSNDVVFSTFSKSTHDNGINELATGHYCRECTTKIEEAIGLIKIKARGNLK